jgi:general secretion pathway protein M
MISAQQLQAWLSRWPSIAAAIYILLIGIFISMTVSTVLELIDRRSAVAAAAHVLERIEARTPALAGKTAPTDVTVPTGSPFVEGPTVSVAGASLLQRVAAATAQVGGNILSSQVDLQGPQSKAAFVSVTASLEVEQRALQRLLYDLEAGMPFIFIDQMTVQAPENLANTPSAKMHVMLSVSGQWAGAK